jgi:hypothetical protein
VGDDEIRDPIVTGGVVCHSIALVLNVPLRRVVRFAE